MSKILSDEEIFKKEIKKLSLVIYDLYDENKRISKKNKDLNLEIKKLKKENKKIKGLNKDILSSSSMKLTKPLRFLRNLFR